MVIKFEVNLSLISCTNPNDLSSLLLIICHDLGQHGGSGFICIFDYFALGFTSPIR